MAFTQSNYEMTAAGGCAPPVVVEITKPACEEHLVVKDTFWMITGKERAMPGDCYCVRCSKPVPYVLRDGKGWPVQP